MEHETGGQRMAWGVRPQLGVIVMCHDEPLAREEDLSRVNSDISGWLKLYCLTRVFVHTRGGGPTPRSLVARLQLVQVFMKLIKAGKDNEAGSGFFSIYDSSRSLDKNPVMDWFRTRFSRAPVTFLDFDEAIASFAFSPGDASTLKRNAASLAARLA